MTTRSVDAGRNVRRSNGGLGAARRSFKATPRVRTPSRPRPGRRRVELPRRCPTAGGCSSAAWASSAPRPSGIPPLSR